MTDEKTEWVTLKVPKADRDKANNYRPDGSTYGDCLVAGAERLNDHLESDPPAGADADITATVTPTLDDEAVDELVDELQSRLSEADPAADQLNTIEQRTGRIERIVEELGGGR